MKSLIEKYILERPDVQEWVYFIEMGDQGPIKIGKTKNVFNRLSALQTSSPYKLRILAVESNDLGRESTLHYQFKRCRLRGEWFDRSPELLNYIEKLESNPSTTKLSTSKSGKIALESREAQLRINLLMEQNKQLSESMSDLENSFKETETKLFESRYDLRVSENSYLAWVSASICSMRKRLDEHYVRRTARSKEFVPVDTSGALYAFVYRAVGGDLGNGRIEKIIAFADEYDDCIRTNFTGYGYRITTSQIISKYWDALSLGLGISVKRVSDLDPAELDCGSVTALPEVIEA